VKDGEGRKEGEGRKVEEERKVKEGNECETSQLTQPTKPANEINYIYIYMYIYKYEGRTCIKRKGGRAA
jgi:hypothetical protein